VGCKPREEGRFPLEGVAGESKVDAEGSIEAREEEVGANVGEESDARLAKYERSARLGHLSEGQELTSGIPSEVVSVAMRKGMCMESPTPPPTT